MFVPFNFVINWKHRTINKLIPYEALEVFVGGFIIKTQSKMTKGDL